MLIKKTFSLLLHSPFKTTLYNTTIKFCFASTSKNLYKVLSVPQSASPAEIKSAYYKLAKQYHPDITKGADDEFKEINSAYETLSDQAKRKEYDHMLKYIYKCSFHNYTSQSSQHTAKGTHSGHSSRYTRQSQADKGDYESPHYGSRRHGHTKRPWEGSDPYNINYSKYHEKASRRRQEYDANPQAEAERKQRFEQEKAQMVQEAIANQRKQMIQMALVFIGFGIMFKLLPEKKRHYPKTNTVADKKHDQRLEKQNSSPKLLSTGQPQKAVSGWEDNIRNTRFV